MTAVDTNVISFFLKEPNPDSRAAAYEPLLEGEELVVSFMTVAELYAWANLRAWGSPRKRRLRDHLARYIVDYSDHALCEAWADIRSECRRIGRPMSGEDVWIAATAMSRGIPLVTDNRKDFRSIEGFNGLVILTASDDEGDDPAASYAYGI